jgi:hypothetical protein
MNCTFHSDEPATHWREGIANKNTRLYLCRACKASSEILELKVHELEPPSEHCPDCGARTGGGRCNHCNELRDKELGGPCESNYEKL